MAKKDNKAYVPSVWGKMLSKFAGLSLVGGIFALFADGSFDPDNFPITLFCIGLFAVLVALSNYVNHKHLFKFYRKNGYEEMFKTDRELCVKIYNANPTKMVLRYIMKLNPEITNIFDFDYSDFKLENYDPHPHIKGDVAV